jgi:quinol-cytochrome oxidoreductase complex cytochrome b subunit
VAELLVGYGELAGQYGVWDAAVGSSLTWATPVVREQKPDEADDIFMFERQFTQYGTQLLFY